jgi:hypothetical protein
MSDVKNIPQIQNMEMEDSAVSDDVDIISRCIRKGTAGFALIAVVMVSICMASVSLILMVQYEPPTRYSELSSIPQCSATSAGTRLTSHLASPIPLWADLMTHQIQIIQNLVHASLLGGSAFVAAYRGDAVWLYFARNCCFYFSLSAFAYLAVGGTKSIRDSNVYFSAFFGTICFIAFIRLEIVRHEVMRLVSRYREGSDGYYPNYLPSTTSQVKKTAIIARLNSKTHIGLLEMSYRLGAHESFLLSLLFLVTTFPGDQACVGGALITSGWRMTVSVVYICKYLPFSNLSDRSLASLVWTSLELFLVTPLFALAFSLFLENSTAFSAKSGSLSKGTYSRVSIVEDSEISLEDPSDAVFNKDCDQIAALHMLQISSSCRFSRSQRNGAFVIFITSFILWIEMTFECMMLLMYDHTISGLSEIIYGWGMHVCAMYLFCCHMSVTSPEVYKRGRWLMAIACPSGTLIAIRQLWFLLPHSLVGYDMFTHIAVFLFTTRAICGIGQSLGIILLSSIEPRDQVDHPIPVDTIDLKQKINRASMVVNKIFIPCLYAYVVEEAFFAKCGEPLLSPTTPGCVFDFFLLAKSWSGFGTFFHFGGLFIIFSNDALSSNPYPPSLAIAILFSGHVSLLLACHLIIMISSHSPDILRQVVPRLLWMLSACLASFSLHTLWKERIMKY